MTKPFKDRSFYTFAHVHFGHIKHIPVVNVQALLKDLMWYCQLDVSPVNNPDSDQKYFLNVGNSIDLHVFSIFHVHKKHYPVSPG